jgi:hypothetical protein
MNREASTAYLCQGSDENKIAFSLLKHFAGHQMS